MYVRTYVCTYGRTDKGDAICPPPIINGGGITTEKCIWILTAQLFRRMAENGFAPPPPTREFCRYILSGRELQAESFKKCLHSVRWGVSL